MWNEIVRALLQELKDTGYTIEGVHDGDELHELSSNEDILDMVGNLDESYLFIEDPYRIRRWILIIPSNGGDCISDYTYSMHLDEIIDRVSR